MTDLFYPDRRQRTVYDIPLSVRRALLPEAWQDNAAVMSYLSTVYTDPDVLQYRFDIAEDLRRFPDTVELFRRFGQLIRRFYQLYHSTVDGEEGAARGFRAMAFFRDFWAEFEPFLPKILACEGTGEGLSRFRAFLGEMFRTEVTEALNQSALRICALTEPYTRLHCTVGTHTGVTLSESDGDAVRLGLDGALREAFALFGVEDPVAETSRCRLYSEFEWKLVDYLTEDEPKLYPLLTAFSEAFSALDWDTLFRLGTECEVLCTLCDACETAHCATRPVLLTAEQGGCSFRGLVKPRDTLCVTPEKPVLVCADTAPVPEAARCALLCGAGCLVPCEGAELTPAAGILLHCGDDYADFTEESAALRDLFANGTEHRLTVIYRPFPTLPPRDRTALTLELLKACDRTDGTFLFCADADAVYAAQALTFSRVAFDASVAPWTTLRFEGEDR